MEAGISHFRVYVRLPHTIVDGQRTFFGSNPSGGRIVMTFIWWVGLPQQFKSDNQLCFGWWVLSTILAILSHAQTHNNQLWSLMSTRPTSPFLCPATQQNKCVGCRRFMVMKPKMWILSCPNPSVGHKTPSCVCMAWNNETFCYAFPWMATALGIICLRVGFKIIWT